MDEQAAKRKRALSELPTLLTPVSPSAPDIPEVPAIPVRAKAMPMPRVKIIGICNEGDATIVVKGLEGGNELIGLRVSTEAVSLTSPILRRLLAETPAHPSKSPGVKPVKVLRLTEDNATDLFNVLNVLHLRNDALPARMEPAALSGFVEVAVKYACIPAVCRAASPWFDYIYARQPTIAAVYQMAWAAMILGDAVYFARFTSRWVLEAVMSEQTSTTLPFSAGTHMMSKALLQRQKDAYFNLRADVDTLIEPLAEAVSEDTSHYVDCAVGDGPTPVALGGVPDPQRCTVDKEGAVEYLGALRDAQIWPASWPPNTNLLKVTEAVANFRIPEYDASEACHHCSNVEDEFALQVHQLRDKLKNRLWGLCLDCFLGGGVRVGDCRYEHAKPQGPQGLMGEQGNPSGRLP